MSRITSEEIRKQVYERAGGRCEYCCKPDLFSPHTHQIDHIVSQKHNGSDDMANPAVACFRCNVCKGSDIGSYDAMSKEFVRFYKPRTDQWDNHFSMENETIIGKTPVGRVTADILQFNHPDPLEARRNLIEAGLW
jgi:5-methylcytosine-specific restriction endonuclease McrA